MRIRTCYYCDKTNELRAWKLPNDSQLNWACQTCWNKWLTNMGPYKNMPKKNLPAIKATPKKKKTKTSRAKHPVDYYSCLMNYAQKDWHHPVTGEKKKITACCKDCKMSAPALSQKRSLELNKLITAYRQVGDSLARLLKPVE